MRDDSLLRAKIKGWFRHHETPYQNTSLCTERSKMTATTQRILKTLKERQMMLGQNVIDGNYKDTKQKKSVLRYLIWHGPIHYMELKKGRTKLFTVFYETVNVKKKDVIPATFMCALSEHALVRLMTRSNAQCLSDMNTAMADYMYAVAEIIHKKNSFRDEFIILSPDGYMPFGVEETEKGYLYVAKTWVARKCWNKNNLERLSTLADALVKNDRGFRTAIFLAEEIDTSPAMLTNNVQGI